jgi:hypothetical protein
MTGSRLSWEEAHRLETALRLRAGRLSSNGHDPSCCPGCGESVDDSEYIRLAGARIHPECLSQYGAGGLEHFLERG